jgi:type IV pilus assembly protein PilB
MELLGNILIRLGYITAEQLNEALIEQRRTPGARIGKILVQMGMICEEDYCQALSKQLHLEMVDLKAISIPEEVIRLVPKQVAESRVVIPVKVERKVLTLAMADPIDLDAEDSVRQITGYQVKPVVAAEGAVLKAIEKYYGVSGLDFNPTRQKMGGAVLNAIEKYYGSRETARSFLSVSQTPDSPIARLVNLIITNAVKKGASDVHLDPQEDQVYVRYRIDGMIRDMLTVPKELQNNLLIRIKIMGRMNIAQSRAPQDGRSQTNVDGDEIDLRISTLPVLHGEKAVIRILGGQFVPKLEQLGFSAAGLKSFLSLIAKPQGLLLVTGPTGSGKTTTLYAALEHLKAQRGNIITVENPIEYQVSGVNQVEILPQAGRTFASSLRAILRQDPDVVMVGEVRDAETAEVAVQAALTGRLILSTMHTSDTASAIARLIELKIQPFLVAPSLIGVVAQRLVRRICKHCKVEDLPAPEIVNRFGQMPEMAEIIKTTKTTKADKNTTYKGKGCSECDYTGYQGRTGIFEILAMTSKMAELINQGCPIATIAAEARASGMRSLLEDGLDKVKAGITSLEEIVRTVMIEDSQIGNRQ